ncbi:MAG: hypothetical protein HUJ61_07150 [Bacilli bacterium]|nr:hypothetical protein [Bacilli bacterium]
MKKSLIGILMMAGALALTACNNGPVNLVRKDYGNSLEEAYWSYCAGKDYIKGITLTCTRAVNGEKQKIDLNWKIGDDIKVYSDIFNFLDEYEIYTTYEEAAYLESIGAKNTYYKTNDKDDYLILITEAEENDPVEGGSYGKAEYHYNTHGLLSFVNSGYWEKLENGKYDYFSDVIDVTYTFEELPSVDIDTAKNILKTNKTKIDNQAFKALAVYGTYLEKNEIIGDDLVWTDGDDEQTKEYILEYVDTYSFDELFKEVLNGDNAKYAKCYAVEGGETVIDFDIPFNTANAKYCGFGTFRYNAYGLIQYYNFEFMDPEISDYYEPLEGQGALWYEF